MSAIRPAGSSRRAASDRRASGPAWLTLYLVDRQGRVVYRHIGEGDYAEIEARIGVVLAAP